MHDSAWYTKDPTIFHPDIFPDDTGGASLQDIRAHYLKDESESSRDLELETWYKTSPERSDDLCDICKHIDLRSLFAQRTRRNHSPILLLRDVLAKRDDCLFCGVIVAALCRADGKELKADDLEDDDYVLGCWIQSEPISPEHPDICILCVHRRQIGVLGGVIGNVGEIQEVRANSTLPYGRHKPEPAADFELVKGWITKCQGEHNSGSTRDHMRYEPHLWDAKWFDIRLIDVEKNCVIAGEWSMRYVALSYIWGGVDQPQAKLANYEALSEEGSLLSEIDGKRVPRTIRDAMRLVKQLGERYLWVDALCIIQDHPEKNQLLDAMDKVYNAAAWCLVAAAAEGADSPLPRIEGSVTTGQKGKIYTTNIQGKSLAVISAPLATVLALSTWSSRAWTYQEGILSTRLLFIFDNQVYFNCYHGFTYCEDVAFEGLQRANGGSTQVSGQIYVVDGETNFEVYAAAVENYSLRNISFQEDALKAFSGVLSVLKTSFRGDFLFGLPDTELDQALLWQPKGSIMRRVDKDNSLLFPSWSWAGWEGGVKYWPNLALSRVKWKDGYTGKYFTSSRFRRPDISDPDEEWFKDTWIRGNPKQEREEWWTHDLCFYEKDKPDMLFLHPVSRDSGSAAWETFTHMQWNTQNLVFSCMSAHFWISGEHSDPMLSALVPCTDRGHIVCALKMLTATGQQAGTVQIPASMTHEVCPGDYEFICLSRTHLLCDSTRAIDMSPFADESDDADRDISIHSHGDLDSADSILSPDDFIVFDESHFDSVKPWCIYNVMLIKTHEGISRRIGLGKVHVDAFLQGVPIWKDVTLA